MTSSCLLLAALAVSASAAEVKYGLGAWPEPGHGNHRALVRVAEPADAVWAHLDWRRRDREPEKKDIRVFDAATGKRVTNVVRVSVTREAGDLVFQPATAPGTYEIYYLPYNPGTGNFDDPGTYFLPQDTADPAWAQRHGITPGGLQTGAWRSLPRAELAEIQARGEFHRMDPMEVIATEAETRALLAANPGRSYLLFPEDRRFPIRMIEDLPQRWILSGPGDSFTGEARPGEYYVFQVGVWAARRGIRNLALDLPDLTAEGGNVIPSREMTCFNLSGSDWLGRPFLKTFEVGPGQVRALWVGVQVPKDAAGSYAGTLTVRPEGAEASSVGVRIKVAGAVLDNGGVDDLWRMSRLKWLNSTLGLDDQVIPPYTPLKVRGSTVACLQREVRFDQLGLPASVVSKGREILAAPMAFTVETPGGALTFSPGPTSTPKLAPATVERLTTADASAASLRTWSRMEADGCLQYRITLKAKADLALWDIRLEVPLRREVAQYMMGLGLRGGYRRAQWRWKWNVDKADNQVWVGDADGGLQLYLQGPKDAWDVVTLHEAGLPASWYNGGQGDCSVTEEGDRVLIRAGSGQRALKAGEELEFRFRLLLTPFKPLDRRHWSWRCGDVAADGNVLHIHHASPQNPYINYPFLKWRELRDTITQVKHLVKRTDFGKLSYPAPGNVNPDHGALHLWVTVNFDPKAGQPMQAQYNQDLFHLNWPNQDEVGFYWNIDDRGMRAYLRQGAPEHNQYPLLFGTHSPDWAHGQRHLLTLSWGEQVVVYVDGKLKGAAPRTGTLATPLAGATLVLEGSGFVLHGLKITDAPYSEGAPVEATADDRTLLLDTFNRLEGTRVSHPERIAAGGQGTFTGVVEAASGPQGRDLLLSSRVITGSPNGVNLYYTVRELSNHVVEMWALRSLGDEVFQGRESFVFSVDKTFFGKPGGGYPWLQEHLGSGYVPAWRQPLWDGDHDAAIATQGLSRWHNYYVEGMNWLMRTTGLDGLYLDGIGYDREIMKRIAKVMVRNNPDCRINFHSGNNYDFMDWHTSPANSYMEHLPYISNLWLGEMYDYNRSPDYWFVEISGIPFGLTSEMLDYATGGNPYRGMIYGMTGRQHPSCTFMWRFWDEFGIQDAEWIGYWDRRCPVKTDQASVLATVYRKPGKTLIALANWPEKGSAASVAVRLSIDWKALGLRPENARIWAPAIQNFQGFAEFRADQPIPVEAGKGWLLILQN